MSKILSTNELINIENNIQGVKFGLDAYNLPSSGIPAYYATAFLPTIVEQILPVLNFEKIAPNPIQAGDFATDFVTYPTAGVTGETHAYGDYSVEGQSDATLNFEFRQTYKFQTTIKVGDEEVAKMGRIPNLDWVGRKRNQAAYQLAMRRNEIGFVGVEGQSTYGILNDPNLRPAVVFTGTWDTKTFEQIQADFLALYNNIVINAGGNVYITQQQKMYLVMAPISQPNLYKANSFGLTVMAWLEQTFPELEVLVDPHYQVGDGTTGNRVQLILEEIAGQPVVYNLVTYMYQSHGAVRKVSSIQEKVSAGSAGAGIFQALGIATGTGI